MKTYIPDPLALSSRAIMKACVLVKTRPGQHNVVARAVSKLDGVKSAFPVLGRTDVVARVEVADIKGLSSLTFKVGGIAGVLATETLVAMEV